MWTCVRTVEALMTREPVVIDWRASLEDAYRLLQRFSFRHLPVVEGETLVGIVSDRDLFLSATVLKNESERGHCSVRRLYASCPVGDVLQTRNVEISPGQEVVQAIRLMLEHGVDALPVTENGQLVGIVTDTDLVDSFVDLCLEHGKCCDAPVSRYMRRVLTFLSPETPIQSALEAIDPELRHALVMEDDELVGIVSDRDLRLGLTHEMLMGRSNNGSLAAALQVGDVISSRTLEVGPDSSLSRACLKMVAEDVGALPVTQVGRPLGIVTRQDVLRHLSSCL